MSRTLYLFLLIAAGLTACQLGSSVTSITPAIVTSIPTETPLPTAAAVRLPSPTFTPEPTAAPTPQPTVPIQPTGAAQAQALEFPTEPLPLSAFPRPPDDNGLGVHWSTHLYAQSDEATSYFVSELVRMNVKWVKLLVDSTRGRDYDDTIEELVDRGIMPVLRIYQQCNTPYDPAELDELVRHYVDMGVYYFETYNEPNQFGESGGWCQPGGAPQP
ncbi:MAG TPA: hypothetical protein VGD99_27955, partial [Anaerolineae bacterium]